MKKLLTIAAIAAATTALAVKSSNTFGILRVDSSAAQTIVSVPWVAAGGGDINVADVVKTANLNDGDKLYYYNGSDYTMWTLTRGAWVQAQNESGETPAQSISRGGAIILERTNPGTCFYLYGQYASDVASTTCVQDGHTLLAPSTTIDFNLNKSGVMTGTPNANDRIGVPVGDSLALLKYVDGKGWGIQKSDFDTSKATIPAGQGVWYISAGGSPTFNWNPATQSAE